MAINQEIYLSGIRGMLSRKEIDSLPHDYEGYKPMFRHALYLKEERELKTKITN